MSNLLFSQEYVEINYKGREGVIYKGIKGVILCEEYFSERYRETYNVYNLSPEEVYELEKSLEGTENRYPSYYRKYQGLIKDGKSI